jgi:adenylate cyclase class 2
MAENIETEVKIYVQSLNAAARRLQSVGAELVLPRTYERNVRYENAEQTLTKSGIVVRLRQDTRVWLTYKSPGTTTGNNIRSRFEAEVEVGDFDTMQTILGQLGYYPFMVYEKYRTTYMLDDTEVVLDEMPYGNFIEIEGNPEAIERAAARLEISDAPRFAQSYTALFDVVRQNMRLDIRDLTFSNFAGVAVPLSAFEPRE